MVELKDLLTEVDGLKKLVREKNEIIEHLKDRLNNQEKQIELLIKDSQEKHLHQIQKYTHNSYSSHLWEDKYLLIKLKEQHPSIFVSSNAEIVPFEELKITAHYNPASDKLSEECHNLSDGLIELKQKLNTYSKLMTMQQSQPKAPEPKEQPTVKEEVMGELMEKMKPTPRKIKTIYIRK